MTPDQRFSLLIAAIGLIFTILVTGAGVIWRIGKSAGETLSEVRANTEDIKGIAESVDRHLDWHINHPGQAWPRQRGAGR